MSGLADRVYCRYLNRNGDQCTGEAVRANPDEIHLCTRHLAEALQLLKMAGAVKVTAGVR
jgi:hypothetical protein